MLELILIGSGILIFLVCVLFIGFKIWQCYRPQPLPETVNDISQPLISEDLNVGQTLRRPSPVSSIDDLKIASEDDHLDSSIVCIESVDSESQNQSLVGKTTTQCSTLVLEVISGPSSGNRISKDGVADRNLSITIGRVPQNDLLVNDPEVSGKHALVNWNSKDLQWELVDSGSLNGTLINSRVISNPDPSLRRCSHPISLTNGDVVTLGSTSQIFVQILNQNISHTRNISSSTIPIVIGVASDPMSMRKGGKSLKMEDVFFFEWPLHGLSQFGVFCIFDGHGGAKAAKAASKIMPEKLSRILVNPQSRDSIIYNCDASDVLRDTFRETEAMLEDEYEGCTATVLLLWNDFKETFYAQCANLGDSACIFNIDGDNIAMTQDHRLTSSSEKARMMEIGMKLKDGETRLCGMNIARVLGDKFLKEQDVRFSAEPYISRVLKLTRSSKAVAIIASDGLWDVLSPNRAMQLALKERDLPCRAEDSHISSAQRIANLLVNEAKKLRTKDNTTVIILDFTIINDIFNTPENGNSGAINY